MTDFADIQRMVHETSRSKGWHDPENDVGPVERFCLMHSEVSEALEEYRNGHEVQKFRFEGEKNKPEGVPIELADVVIRIMDFCEKYGIDLEEMILIKNQYNAGRDRLHGGKKL